MTDDAVPASLSARAARCLERGRYAEACADAEQALAALGDAPGEPPILAVLETLQEASIALGRLPTACAAATRALHAAVRLHGEHSLPAARAMQRLGVVEARLGDRDAAQARFLKARTLLGAMADEPAVENELATTLLNLAGTYHDPAVASTARALYDEALVVRRRLSGEAHLEIAKAYSGIALLEAERSDDSEALAYGERGLALRQRVAGPCHPDTIRSLLELGWLHLRRGAIEPATAATLQALAALAFYELPTVEARGWFLLACVLEAHGADEAVVFCQKLTVNIYQSLRDEAGAVGIAGLDRILLAAREDAYRQLANSLITAGRLPEAHQILAMLKESELAAVTEGILKGVTRATLTPAEQAWREAERRVGDAIRRGLGPADRPAECPLSPEATAAMAGWFDRLRTRPTTSPKAREDSAPPAGLPSDRLELRFLLAPDHVRVIATGRQGERLHEASFPAGEVHRRVLAMRLAIEDRSDAYLAEARALYDLLFAAPLDGLAPPSGQTVAVSLDGVLRYLPLAALHDGQRHLVERVALELVCAAPRVGEPGRGNRRAAGLGVTRALAGHRALPGVQQELSAIVRTPTSPAGLLPGIIRLDEAFTADALREALGRDYSVVHIASHFTFRTAREESSYLLLGDGTRLTPRDLAELSFAGVELLVLSACDTAVTGGQASAGHGFEGLGALARRRGAGHVVATLWAIRDFTSARLMRRFYRHRYEAGLSPAEALRQAQLALLRRTDLPVPDDGARSLIDPDEPAADDAPAGIAHPYHWAAYTLMS